MHQRNALLSLLVAGGLLLSACAPAAAPAPTAKPAAEPTKPAAAAPTSAPAAKPAESPAPTAAAKPAADAKPAASPAAAPAPAAPAAPAAAASPAAKPAAAATFDEKAVADFYTGKTIRIIVGFAPGGGFDTYSRLLAKHMGKYIPGNPTIIVENREGAGSLTAANYVARQAEKDGTVIANFNEQLVLQQVLGAPGIEFDAKTLNWIGSAVESPSACAVRNDVGINSIQEVLGGKEWIVGVEAPGTTTYDVPAVLKGLLGANIKMVPGYTGTSRMRLALENKEVDGVCFTWESLQSTGRSWFEANPPLVKVLVIMGSKTPEHPWLKDVPPVEDLAKDPQTRQLLQVVDTPAKMSKPYSVAPEVPKDRVEALRAAFMKTMNDPEMKADAQKANLGLTPLNGQELTDLVAKIMATPPDQVAKLKEVVK